MALARQSQPDQGVADQMLKSGAQGIFDPFGGSSIGIVPMSIPTRAWTQLSFHRIATSALISFLLVLGLASAFHIAV
jgi:hypothetical protein